MGLSFLISANDRQQIGAIDLEQLRTVYSEYFELAQSSAEVSLVTLGEMKSYNSEYRNIDEPTDVLSFPLFTSREEFREIEKTQPVLIGSILICPEKATAYQESLSQLVHHGLLHLLGYDHEQDMNSWQVQEQALLNQLAAQGLRITGVPNDSL